MIEYIHRIVIQHIPCIFFWILGHCHIHITSPFIFNSKIHSLFVFLFNIFENRENVSWFLYHTVQFMEKKKTAFQISLLVYV